MRASALVVAGSLTLTSAQDILPIPFVTIAKDVAGKDVNLPLIGAGTWQYNNTEAYDSLCKVTQYHSFSKKQGFGD